jgi:hypothetical protein
MVGRLHETECTLPGMRWPSGSGAKADMENYELRMENDQWRAEEITGISDNPNSEL